MKLKKKALILAGLMMAVLATGCGKVQIGYIDAERVLTESPQMKALSDEGNQKYQEAIKEAEEKLKANPNLSQEEAQKAQQETQRKLSALNQSYSLQMKQKLDVALGEIARAKELDAIVQNSEEQPIGLTGCVDVTDETIAKLQ